MNNGGALVAGGPGEEERERDHDPWTFPLRSEVKRERERKR